MVRGNIQYVRKHTGSVVNELNAKIIDTINLMEDEFIQLKRHSEQMKQIELAKVQAAEMYGRMFMIDDIITPTQLSVIKKELDNSKFEPFKDETLWSAYN